MRVITGTARGVRLETPEGLNTRPTTERVKEAVFSSIMNELYGASVLDMFSGSGQMGIEALSRGAERCTFVDCSTETLILRNLRKTKLEDRAQVSARLPAGGAYDLVFLDPPYGKGLVERTLRELLEREYLRPGALIVAESDGEPEPLPEGLILERERHYGRVCIAYIGYRRESER